MYIYVDVLCNSLIYTKSRFFLDECFEVLFNIFFLNFILEFCMVDFNGPLSSNIVKIFLGFGCCCKFTQRIGDFEYLRWFDFKVRFSTLVILIIYSNSCCRVSVILTLL